MQIVHDTEQLRGIIAGWQQDGDKVGFVPTMGNLHRGHLSLMQQCRRLSDRVVSSVFVNPLQFAPGEDYDSYPRTLEADSAALAKVGVDLLFAPPTELIYPGDSELRTRIHVPALEGMLCGVSRPSFFSGVATVVNLLFNLVRPQLAVFGEKDYQQLLVIRRMVSDLQLPIAIIGGPIVREADGLAMSSRNAYLDADQRRRAPVLYQTLRAACEQLAVGSDDFAAIEARGSEALDVAGLRCDYFSVRRAADLRPAEPGERQLRILAAAQLGRARLIDNIGIDRD